MRLLILSQHYAPEITAATARATAFATGLAARGHEVRVLTEMPNHPSGVIPERFRGRRRVNQVRDGVSVSYLWVRSSTKKTTKTRLLLYASYAAAAVLAGMSGSRPDLVIATSPPLPVGLAAATIARRHRVPWVFDIRDLWPEAAVVLGELGSRTAIAAAEGLERWLYRDAAQIVTVTEPFREQIAAFSGSEAVTLIPNGTGPPWLGAGASDPDREAARLPEDQFVWGYGGNVGIGQGLDAAIEAAALLGPSYRLLILGEGPRLEAIKDAAQRLPEGWIEFRPLLPATEAARVLRACDALLVPLADRPELAKFVPSKLFDYCALGVPVLVAAPGESQRLVAERGAGTAVEPGDSAALAAAVRQLRDDPAAAAALASESRRFAVENLREDGVNRLAGVLDRLVS